MRDLLMLFLGTMVIFTSGACLRVYAPPVRAGVHHAAVEVRTPDATCLGCHEPETAAMTRLVQLEPRERELQMHHMMEGGGAALVAEWMLDDERGCIGCHGTRGF